MWVNFTPITSFSSADFQSALCVKVLYEDPDLNAVQYTDEKLASVWLEGGEGGGEDIGGRDVLEG